MLHLWIGNYLAQLLANSGYLLAIRLNREFLTEKQQSDDTVNIRHFLQ